MSAIDGLVTSFPATGFLRLLAKIGHAFATAKFGEPGFRSVLVPLVLGEDVSSQFYLIDEMGLPMKQASSALQHRVEPIAGERWLFAEISLHFFPKLPRYQVACAKLRDDAEA